MLFPNSRSELRLIIFRDAHIYLKTDKNVRTKGKNILKNKVKIYQTMHFEKFCREELQNDLENTFDIGHARKDLIIYKEKFICADKYR